MNKIDYKKVSHKKITKHFLNGYIRFQETKTVFYLKDDILKQKEDSFTEEWDQKKLIKLSLYLKKSVKEGGVLYAAYDQKQIIGFALIEKDVFYKEYINLAYIHTCKGYRGFKIGTYLLQLIAIEAYRKGAKKLYISAHPAYETQMFYKNNGCILAKKINPELLAVEPLDIQLEFSIDPYIQSLKLIDLELNTHLKQNATVVFKIASKLYRFMPKEESMFLKVCKQLLISDNRSRFSLGTLFLKRRKDVLKKENMVLFDEILQKYIHEWDQVDQYCYRVLNPMIELDESYYSYLLKWSDSTNKDVRRASLVSMIQSSRVLTLDYDFEKMIFLVEKLKNDTDIHVRKAVGWVLKCSAFKYPRQLENYLRTNVENLDRLIFRYALEHIPDPLRTELIEL